MRYLSLLTILLLLSSCATKQELSEVVIEKYVKIVQNEQIEDFKIVPQDVRVYAKNMHVLEKFSQDKYEKKYFQVWNYDKPKVSLNDAMWAHRTYKVGNTYGENLQLLQQSFYDILLENANFKNFATINKQALTLKLVNLRAMPTDEPVLLNPNKAGEGFPFDYLQNSSIAANKPLFLSHYSKDGEWAFVESSFAYGWVKTRDIVIIEKKYTDEWQKAVQMFVVKEGVPLYSEDNHFLFKTRIGMMFALIAEDDESYRVLAISKYKNTKPLYVIARIDKDVLSRGTLTFNKKNIIHILNEVASKNYGWGGIYGQRDCSSTLRDFYAPFGLWLPRNSYQQSKMGEVLSLDVLTPKQKIKEIKEKAIPFRTLLYKRGHIVLYVGTYNDKVIVFQNVWGVKTLHDGVEGRFIIGRPVFSTLEIGKNLRDFDSDGSLLKNLKSMTTL